MINYRPESIPDPAHHSTIDYISDVDISEIYLGENNIYIKGSSICNTIVSLDNEGDTDINFDFPMTFNLEMGYENRKLKIMDTGETEIEIDDNSFYS